jgi:hypothetical protein
MDPGLGVIHAGAKVTQLGAVDVDAKPPCHLSDDAELALTWQRIGAIVIGAKPDAIDLGVELLEFIKFGILSRDGHMKIC